MSANGVLARLDDAKSGLNEFDLGLWLLPIPTAPEVSFEMLSIRLLPLSTPLSFAASFFWWAFDDWPLSDRRLGDGNRRVRG